MTEASTPLMSNPFLQTIIEVSDFGILALDADGRIIAWNPWLAEHTAVPEEKAIRNLLNEIIDGIPQNTLDTCADVLSKGRPRILSPILHNIIIPLTKPSQQMGRFYPVFDEHGRTFCVVIFIHDVSPALEYERFVEDEFAAERLDRENIFQAIGHPTFILDKEHTIIASNRAAREIPGSILRELVGRKCYEVMHGAATPPPGCPFTRMRTSGLLETEEMIVETLDRVFLVSCTPLFDKNGLFDKGIHIAIDITEHKRTEDKLRLSEERYSAFVKQSSEAICLFEIEHAPIDTTLPIDEQIDLLYANAIIGECNKIFATSHGFNEPDDMLGFKIGQVFPRLAKENVDYLIRFIQNGHHISGVETKELSRGGSIKYFLNSLIGHLDCGKLIRIWGAKQDISIIKKVEEEIRTLNAELEQRVLARTEQLEAANRELDAFAYSVSHDLRAPLRAVNGFTEILVENFGSILDAEGRRICSIISESAKTMGKLIDDLLSFSRLGRAEMRPSQIDMAGLAGSIFFELTSKENRERIDLRIGPVPPVIGDPPLLRQIFTNLLSNAIKFSSKKEQAVIEIGFIEEKTAENSTPVYFIKDNGAGFDMRYADKLFGVFQRLHSKKDFEGTGVGLAIVERIIKRHGGRIWAEGEIDKGATFYFTFG